MKTRNWIIGIATAAAATGGTVFTDSQINPYVDIGTHYELSVSNEIAQTDRVMIAKDKAEATLEKWGGEDSITIRRAGVFKPSTRALMSKTRKMEARNGKEAVLIEPVRQNLTETDDGVKIDILLNERPDVNFFSFEIEGYENFNFWYQPPLNQEFNDSSCTETTCGDVNRPENVVGSYAVYHKSKRNNEYATGKAFHIYRPKVFDSDGKEVWAQLMYKDGVLDVIVPTEFFRDAVYPVRVDPTFGYTTCGASDDSFAAQVNDRADRIGESYTVSEDGYVQSMHACLKVDSGTENMDTTMTLNEVDSVASGSHGEITQVETTGLALNTTATTINFVKNFGWGQVTSTSTGYIINVLGDGFDLTTSFQAARIMQDSIGSIDSYDESVNGGYTTLRDEDPWTEVVDTGGTLQHSLYVTYAVNYCYAGKIDIDSFESESDADKTFDNNWVNGGGDDCDWQAETGATGSSNTGASDGSDGTVFIYTEASSGASNCETTSDVALLDYNGTMPSGSNTGQVKWDYHMWGAAMGTLDLQGNNGSWVNLWTLTGDQGDNWFSTTTTFDSTYTDLRFRGTRGSDFTSDMSLDFLWVCEEITAVASASGVTPSIIWFSED